MPAALNVRTMRGGFLGAGIGLVLSSVAVAALSHHAGASDSRGAHVLVADTVIAGQHWHAEAKVEPIPAGFPWATQMFCNYGHAARTYVRSLTIGKISVPLSCYADLGDPERIHFVPHPSGELHADACNEECVLLVMEGNSGGYSEKQGRSLWADWSVTFTIGGGYIVRRVIWATVPGIPAEYTDYEVGSD